MSPALNQSLPETLKSFKPRPRFVLRQMVPQLLLALFALALFFNGNASAQDAATLPNYVPLLPQVKAEATPIDPQKGYAVRELKPNIYMITDGAYESVFATTGKGVVLFDAPPSFAQHIVQAVAETTSEPIVELVYSHEHVDHIGGAGLILKQVPNLKILANEETAKFLREIKDPNRPVPTQTFKGRYALELGSFTADMSVGYWHTPTGDLLIYIPDKKFVMAIDAFSAGATPFMGFDLTQNMPEYLKIFDRLLAMDWDVLVPGHHSTPASKTDVEIAQRYVTDVVNTAARILEENHKALLAQATNKYVDNKWAVAAVLVDNEVDQCANEIKGRWITKLEGVDIWASSHCRTALVYEEWDVGSRKAPALSTARGQNGLQPAAGIIAQTSPQPR
jgi:glyoxylase-like metal-dependent hydrolase (beta-lactamase superfamily II)